MTPVRQLYVRRSQVPDWEDRWLGGRYYRNDDDKKVFVIEKRIHPHRYSIKLQTHHEDIANAEFTRFLLDPAGYVRPPPAPDTPPDAVFITAERLTLYMESISDTVIDHRKARRSYLQKWAAQRLDLRTVDRETLRAALNKFKGGHRGRTEALNAFCRFMVAEGVLPSWNPLVNFKKPKPTRAEREAYSVEQLTAVHEKLEDQPTKDLFLLRAATGMHHTELEQLEGAKVFGGPLPEKGTGIRVLGGEHEIQGVLQVMHKSRRRHRQSVDAAGLRAALRLRERVPHRIAVWKALDPVIPSNLRHTFITLAGEVGTLVQFKDAGVDRGRIAQIVGHRAGSTMTADRYEKVQVPPMVRLPLGWNVL
jgi:integrase